jgi:hypothetical protein
MRTFTDSAGHAWQVVINTNSIKRAKAASGANLVDILDGELYARLLLDPVLVCQIAYGVCRLEAESRKFSEEDFYAALTGDAIAAARRAILEDLSDFFPNPIRGSLQSALAGGSPSPDGKPGDSSSSSPATAAATPGS